jgi:tetratricopeptide (TPR) repeat protein
MTWRACLRGGLLERFGLLLPVLLGGMVVLCPSARPARAQYDDRVYPTTNYHAAFAFFYEGEYQDALRQFEDALSRDSLKFGQARWIDSICYHTMVGECYYHMGGVGDLDKALFHYSSALELYLAYPDWMMWVKPPPTIRPAQTVRPIPWGPRTRRSVPGQFPSTMLIGMGRLDQTDVLRRGGVLQQAQYRQIEVQEIVRCTTLAIRRRTELLGPLSPYDPLTARLIAALSRNPGLRNHWSQAWIDVEQGLALIAGGKASEALRLLSRGSVAAGQFDHPLTSTALLELGRMALVRGDYPAAAKYFHEATIAAVDFFDGGVLEEAFQYGALTHLLANQKGVFPALEPAAAWAGVKDLRRLRVSLLLSAAENLLVLGKTRQAAATLDDARAAIGPRFMGRGRIGARLAYLTAMLLFQQRKVVAGDEALAAAMDYERHGSSWLYQIRYLDGLFTGKQVTMRGPITPRNAMELYGELLRDPQPADWGLRPMDALASLRTPHPESFEHWFLAALQRNDHEAALEIADRARRHRFFSSLAYGGRLQSLRWILEAPDAVLDQEAKLNRQNLVAQHPAYVALSRRARQIHAALEDMPLVPDDPDAALGQRKQLSDLGATSVQQEAILREIAVRRDPAEMVFPPLLSFKEIQKRLPEGDVVLTFFAAGGDLYGFLLNRDQYSHWRVKSPQMVTKRLMDLLRAMGHFDENRQLSLKDLESPEWKYPARQLLELILEGSRADFTASFPELVIVPDGLTWYVPFEALLVDVDGEVRPLISRFRIRYAPTLSLAVPDARGRNLAPQTAVVLGRLYPRDDDAVAQAAFEELARVVPRSVAIPKSPLPGPSALYASLIDQLIVLDDLKLDNRAPYALTPIPTDRGKPGNTLSDWLALPWQGPEVVILPGYHTAAERSLQGINSAAPGSELFLTVCGLMSSGARTLLLSRWRSGGQSSFDLVREFAQELPHTTPADAWQRAVLVVADSRLNLDAEPRIQRAVVAEAPKASHPFFWCSMLVDSGVLPEQKEAKPEPPVIEFEAPGGKELQDGEARGGAPKKL